MKIWLDDDRDPNDSLYWEKFPQLKEGGWTWVKTVSQAKQLIENGNVEFISFDNDLQQAEEGYHLANWIEEKAYWKELPKINWEVHSKNSVAAPLIEIAMRNADKFWDSNERLSKNWYKLYKQN